MTFTKLKTASVISNHIQGSYRPVFFNNPFFALSRTVFESAFYSDTDTESKLLKGAFSFAYLREDKLRTISAYDFRDNLIPFSEFAERTQLSIRSTNIFKSGKYLSRVFRPTRFGGFYKNLKVFVNDTLPISKVDGLSMISVSLAKSLGIHNAEANQSAQLTLFFRGGLVKGHCIFSDKIAYDIVIYGHENIKDEISFDSELYYVALEPVKVSNHLRLDIQSMLNLWQLFGQKQYFAWAARGIEQFQRDLKSGRLSIWLDNFDGVTTSDYDIETWTLQKAVWHKIDYRSFPGLVRQAWSLFRKSLLSYSENRNGVPVFRIHVPGGMRGYFRLDLRNHNIHGDLTECNLSTDIELDRNGNIWINPEIVEDFLAVKGGADLDDSAGIIPVTEGKAVIYRNPNQYGEFGIHTISYEGFSPSALNVLVGKIPLKASISNTESPEQQLSGNKLFDDYLAGKTYSKPTIPYTLSNLIRTFAQISTNSANVGVAANAEMIRSSIGIKDKPLMDRLLKRFNWNLERVIDSTVKEGISCEHDMQAVTDLQTTIIENGIPIASSIKHRLPEKLVDMAATTNNHPLDELLEALKLLIHKADTEILGAGSVSKGNRVKGYVDRLEIPVVEIGLSNVSNTMTDAAINLYKDYNRSIAIMMDETKNLLEWEREIKRRQSIEIIQNNLIAAFEDYSESEKREIVKCWAYEIYRGDRAVHDSILWMNGVADYTIKMLADVGIAYHVKHNGSIKRFHEVKTDHYKATSVRLWSKEELRAASLSNEASVLICDGKALLGAKELFIGDECLISDGVYNISKVVQAVSRKSRGMLLRNSVTLYLD